MDSEEAGMPSKYFLRPRQRLRRIEIADDHQRRVVRFVVGVVESADVRMVALFKSSMLPMGCGDRGVREGGGAQIFLDRP